MVLNDISTTNEEKEEERKIPQEEKKITEEEMKITEEEKTNKTQKRMTEDKIENYTYFLK